MAKIIIAGKAASGKDFLKNRLRQRGLKCGVSHTTRPMRPGEVEGETYYFISEEQFLKMKDEGQFYETANFNSWWYGTSKKEFDEKDVFLMTPAGIAQLTEEDRKRSFIMFLDISDELRRFRLNQRVMPGDSVERRIEADNLDFNSFTDFDARFTNENF